jgi:hypothetical protein
MASVTGGHNLPAMSIATARTCAMGYPQGSRQRAIGELWLAWLEHIYACQRDGLVQHTEACPTYRTINAFEAAYPDWDCCEAHKRLGETRRRLTESAEAMNLVTAPHQDPTVLTPRWWRLFGKQYQVGQTVTP